MRDTLRQELSARFSGLEGADRTEADDLVRQLAAAWEREAAGNPDPNAVYTILRSDLDKALVDASPPARLDRLRVEVLGRRADALSATSLALGKGVVDGRIAGADAESQGRAVMADAEALSAALKRVSDPAVKQRLERKTQESMLEGLYAVERKAMSQRLNRYAEAKAPQ